MSLYGNDSSSDFYRELVLAPLARQIEEQRVLEQLDEIGIGFQGTTIVELEAVVEKVLSEQLAELERSTAATCENMRQLRVGYFG